MAHATRQTSPPPESALAPTMARGVLRPGVSGRRLATGVVGVALLAAWLATRRTAPPPVALPVSLPSPAPREARAPPVSTATVAAFQALLDQWDPRVPRDPLEFESLAQAPATQALRAALTTAPGTPSPELLAQVASLEAEADGLAFPPILTPLVAPHTDALTAISPPSRMLRALRQLGVSVPSGMTVPGWVRTLLHDLEDAHGAANRVEVQLRDDPGKVTGQPATLLAFSAAVHTGLSGGWWYLLNAAADPGVRTALHQAYTPALRPTVRAFRLLAELIRTAPSPAAAEVVALWAYAEVDALQVPLGLALLYVPIDDLTPGLTTPPGQLLRARLHTMHARLQEAYSQDFRAECERSLRAARRADAAPTAPSDATRLRRSVSLWMQATALDRLQDRAGLRVLLPELQTRAPTAAPAPLAWALARVVTGLTPTGLGFSESERSALVARIAPYVEDPPRTDISNALKALGAAP